ncbi:MAG: 3-hydroxyacyl-CoA dehydrogenase, partial [Oscillochloris sp.]|nr:3-hydroxyacyl-CoA dehydrogenase [Oscillochloris sp.]
RNSDGIVTLTMDWPDSPVNLMDRQFIPVLEEVVARLESEREQIAGVLLASAKASFFAGGDLKWFLKIPPGDTAQAFDLAERTKALLRRLERLGRPVVALINGSALGGGWELALACHQRIVLNTPATQLGTPEVTLGLLPGGGGVTRMVRLLGLEAAMPYLMEGKLMRPADAAQWGLAALASDPEDMLAQARAWVAANPSPSQPWDRKGYSIPGGTPSNPKVAQLAALAPALLIAKTRGVYPAPQATLCAAVEGAQVDFASASRIESRYFAELLVGQVARNMIGAFFVQMQELKSGASRPPEVPRWKARRVGVLGAGMMGAGIAYANASRGVAVVLQDVSLARAEAGREHSAQLTAKRVERGQISAEQREQTLARIQATADVEDLAGCDLIIEAVFESSQLKAEVTRQAEPLLIPGGIFASNTSTLPISGLAEAAAHPEQFIGLHFFSPVDRMQLVEIIRGRRTSPETVARAYDYVLQLGKLPIVVNDARGFFTSRVIRTFLNEATAMLAEGVPPAAIEHAALQAGFPTGPLALLDEVSLRLAQSVAGEARMAAESAGQPYAELPGEAVITRMLEEFGRAGKAAGGGFYDYPSDGKGKKQLWPGLRAFGSSAPAAPMDVAALKDRLLYVQAVETARCLEEGVLESVRDANIGSIFGIGYPGWTGGAAQFINHVGPAAFVRRADELASAHGPRFAPPITLLDLARSGGALA